MEFVSFIAFIISLIFFLWFVSKMNAIRDTLLDINKAQLAQTRLLAALANAALKESSPAERGYQND
jgi:hypothetical protein